MKFVIAGGTGFIGSYLLQFLSRQPHEIIILTREASRFAAHRASTVKYVHWGFTGACGWEKEIEKSDVVINLTGKNIFESRWNEQVKKEILNSRVIPARLLVEAIAKAERKPKLFLSISAIGFYGDRSAGVTDSAADPNSGEDFMRTSTNTRVAPSSATMSISPCRVR